MDKPVLDVFGDHWSVSEIRPTAHGWRVSQEDKRGPAVAPGPAG